MTWESLGYSDRDDMVRRGYDLEPEEIRLAVLWLELNEPESAVGLDEVKALTARERSREAAAATDGKVLSRGRPPEETADEMVDSTISQSERAKRNGVSRDTQKKLDALARKAPDKLAEVQRGEKSTHRACVEAGIVKIPSPLVLLQRAWEKATPAQREAFVEFLRHNGHLGGPAE